MRSKNKTYEKFGEFLKSMTFMEEEFRSQSDIGVVILSSIYLDVLIETILETFVNLDANTQKLLFGIEKPLGSFSAKITLAFALGLISYRERKELDQIRKIRNIFAHEISKVSFKTTSIKDRCSNLKILDILFSPNFRDVLASNGIIINNYNGEYKDPSDMGTREKYIESVRTITHILMVRLVEADKKRCSSAVEFESLEEFFRKTLNVAEWQKNKAHSLKEEYNKLTKKKCELLKEIEKISGKKYENNEKEVQDDSFIKYLNNADKGNGIQDDIIERLKKTLDTIKKKE